MFVISWEIQRAKPQVYCVSVRDDYYWINKNLLHTVVIMYAILCEKEGSRMRQVDYKEE